MEKTLFLSENPKRRIRRDGPSLWVEQEGEAGTRIPARVIRRVLIRGNVRMDAGCLTLFAERGVPVTLFGTDGMPSAVVLPVATQEGQRRTRQRALLEDRARQDRILAWMLAWERGRQVALIGRLAPHIAKRWKRVGFRKEDYDAVLTRRLDVPVEESGERAFVAGMVFEFILAEISVERWDPHVGVRHQTGPLGFAHDLTDVLGAEADRIWIAALERSAAPVATSFTLVREFERARPRLEKLLRSLLRQYERILWEL